MREREGDTRSEREGGRVALVQGLPCSVLILIMRRRQTFEKRVYCLHIIKTCMKRERPGIEAKGRERERWREVEREMEGGRERESERWREREREMEGERERDGGRERERWREVERERVRDGGRERERWREREREMEGERERDGGR